MVVKIYQDMAEPPLTIYIVLQSTICASFLVCGEKVHMCTIYVVCGEHAMCVEWSVYVPNNFLSC